MTTNTVTARRPLPPTVHTALNALRRAIGRWGLIIALLALPVIYGIHDLVTGYPGYAHGHATTSHDLTYLANNLIAGLSNGSIWALIAIGYTLVYGIIELINFAHGDVFMLGSMTAAGLWGSIGLGLATGPLGLVLGLLLTLVVSMITCGSLNVLIERVGYRPLRNAPKLAPLITAIGFSFILQNVGLLWMGGSPVGVSDLIHQNDGCLQDLCSGGPALGCARDRGHYPARAADDLVHLAHAGGEGDARDRPGPRGSAADGHQHRQHDLAHVPDRRDARGCGRVDLRPCTRRRSGTSRASRPA